jgi:hypothetical protein
MQPKMLIFKKVLDKNYDCLYFAVTSVISRFQRDLTERESR